LGKRVSDTAAEPFDMAFQSCDGTIDHEPGVGNADAD
jgi:hypothetical protein